MKMKKFIHNDCRYLISILGDKEILLAKEEFEIGMYLVIKKSDFFMFLNAFFNDRLDYKSFLMMVEHIDTLLLRGARNGAAMKITELDSGEVDIIFGDSIDADLKEVILRKYGE